MSWRCLDVLRGLSLNTLTFDPRAAYRYYAHSLKVEVSQSHPVMKAFCGLLLDIMVEGGRAGQKIRDAEEGRDPELQTHTRYTCPHTRVARLYM